MVEVGVEDESEQELLLRIRELTLVEIDALAVGSTGQGRRDLLDAFADDLRKALDQARMRMRGLMADMAKGPDPLALVDASAGQRNSENAIAAAERAAAQLVARGEMARRLARLDDACAELLPRFLAADRQHLA